MVPIASFTLPLYGTASTPSGRFSAAQMLPELAGRQDRKRYFRSDVEQIGIAGDQDVGLRIDRRSENPAVIAITNRNGCWLLRLRHDLDRVEHGLCESDAFCGQFELGLEHTAEFSENHFTQNEIMFREDCTQDIGA